MVATFDKDAYDFIEGEDTRLDPLLYLLVGVIIVAFVVAFLPERKRE